jgi:hypothetical protein
MMRDKAYGNNNDVTFIAYWSLTIIALSGYRNIRWRLFLVYGATV